ncbi:hypothetical protein CVT25_004673 [Psilocybe cyanescens]|uniref:Uncharacterized protein n=1 Tax=Psilocybe cyanescens TaxID=93625 RepID=A0A409XVV0_PSICY|nr:hypothetical protein CVT25_004673 [Psilocybe cyanescens]
MSHSTACASSVPQPTTTSSQLFNTLSVYELLEILKNAKNQYDIEALCPPFIEQELEFFNYLSGKIQIIEADITVKRARVRVHHKAAADSLDHLQHKGFERAIKRVLIKHRSVKKP